MYEEQEIFNYQLKLFNNCLLLAIESHEVYVERDIY